MIELLPMPQDGEHVEYAGSIQEAHGPAVVLRWCLCRGCYQLSEPRYVLRLASGRVLTCVHRLSMKRGGTAAAGAQADTDAGKPSEIARSVRRPLDRQAKQSCHSTGKPGTRYQRAIVAYRNRRVVTVAGYLASRGASADLVKRLSSAVGRKVAAAYRAATGSEPTQSGWAIAHGRILPVFAYASRELLATVVNAYEVKSPKRARLLDLIGA